MVNLSYNYSGEWEDVSQVLRTFSADTILKRISREAIEIQRNKNASDPPAAKWVEYTIFNTRTKRNEIKKSLITMWSLIELAYYAVKATNDYRGQTTIDDSCFYMLIDAVDGLKQKNEEGLLNSIGAEGKDFFLYLWGFVGEQLKAESPKKMFDNAGRDLYILFESAKKIDGSVDISAAVEEETGFCWEKIVCALIIGWANSSIRDSLNISELSFLQTDLLSKGEFTSIINRYSINYEGIRESELKRQVFYTKPYVNTQKNELIGVSPYLCLCIYEHSILWTIRDYYRKKGSNAFIIQFGRCFETYFEELLAFSLARNEYEKIPEDNKAPRADWKIEIDGQKFLIEQKSAFLRLDAKQQESNINTVEDYAKKNIIKAIRQLTNTEKALGDGPYYKIVLLYEDYLYPAVMDRVLEMDECKTEHDGRCWLATIEEIEKLLPLCINQREVFAQIIKEKAYREANHSNKGKSFSQIMREFSITDNPFLRQERIDYYRNFALSQAKKVLGEE